MLHNLRGGTGSGMGTLIMSEIVSNFPDTKVGDYIIHLYNTILSLCKIDEFCDGSFVIENNTLFSLAYNKFKIKQPRIANLNFISNQVINDISIGITKDQLEMLHESITNREH